MKIRVKDFKGAKSHVINVDENDSINELILLVAKYFNTDDIFLRYCFLLK
jgi:hypothetical protein